MITNFITQFFRKLTGTEWLRRFEILLPLKDNNGQPFTADVFDRTADEFEARFGNLTLDKLRIEGAWLFAGTRFRDDLIRIRIDTGDPAARTFLKKHKKILKDRFRQIDIWITAFDIEVI
jgi:hypothetical protein